MGKTSDAPGIAGAPTGQQTTAPSGGPSVVPVDQAKVAALMKKVSANPKDTASLLTVGDIYFAAADYKDASVFEQKVLGVDPKNQAALLAVGAPAPRPGIRELHGRDDSFRLTQGAASRVPPFTGRCTGPRHRRRV